MVHVEEAVMWRRLSRLSRLCPSGACGGGSALVVHVEQLHDSSPLKGKTIVGGSSLARHDLEMCLEYAHHVSASDDGEA